MTGHSASTWGVDLTHDSDKRHTTDGSAVPRRHSAKLPLASGTLFSDPSQATPISDRFPQVDMVLTNGSNGIASHEIAAGVHTTVPCVQPAQHHQPQGFLMSQVTSATFSQEPPHRLTYHGGNGFGTTFNFPTVLQGRVQGLGDAGQASAASLRPHISSHVPDPDLRTQPSGFPNALGASCLGQNLNNDGGNSSSSNSTFATATARHPLRDNAFQGLGNDPALVSRDFVGTGMITDVASSLLGQQRDDDGVVLAATMSTAPAFTLNGPAQDVMAQSGVTQASAYARAQPSSTANLPTLITPSHGTTDASSTEPACEFSFGGKGDDALDSFLDEFNIAGVGVGPFDGADASGLPMNLSFPEFMPSTEHVTSQRRVLPRGHSTSDCMGAPTSSSFLPVAPKPSSSVQRQARSTTATAASSMRPVHARGEDMLGARLAENGSMGSPSLPSSKPYGKSTKSKPGNRRRKRPRMSELPPKKQEKQRLKARMNARRRRAQQVEKLQELEQRAAELKERQEELQLHRARLIANRDLEIERLMEILRNGHGQLPALSLEP